MRKVATVATEEVWVPVTTGMRNSGKKGEQKPCHRLKTPEERKEREETRG